ncbi:MAG TPA: hypothetical protein VK308_12240, partial [Pyrinomonadaceae bacterium]|nr:hypothetical protein [Pyrinomonadaceae bacterium]
VNGNYNAFFGLNAGRLNNESGVGGNENVFFGVNAGTANTTGTGNSFFGTAAGFNNKFGNYNTLLGWNANVSTNNLTYASAVGAGATVSQNDSIVLGKTAGTYNGVARPADTVRIPGDVIVGGNVKVGAAGNLSAVAAEENLRIVRGHIQISAGNATVFSGSGFTVTRHSTGVFSINFTTPFAGDVILTPSLLNYFNAPQTAILTEISNSSVRVNVFGSNGAPADPLSLLFIAVGTR